MNTRQIRDDDRRLHTAARLVVDAGGDCPSCRSTWVPIVGGLAEINHRPDCELLAYEDRGPWTHEIGSPDLVATALALVMATYSGDES